MAPVKHCIFCGNIDKENAGVSLFYVPSGKLEEWQKCIPQVQLGSKSRICERHFHPSDIVKGKEIQDVFYPLKRAHLTKDALPKLHLAIHREKTKRRKPLQPILPAASSKSTTRNSHLSKQEKPKRKSPIRGDGECLEVLAPAAPSMHISYDDAGMHTDNLFTAGECSLEANEEKAERRKRCDEAEVQTVDIDFTGSERCIEANEEEAAPSKRIPYAEAEVNTAVDIDFTASPHHTVKGQLVKPNTHSNCRGCHKFVSISSRRKAKGINCQLQPSSYCKKCFKYKNKILLLKKKLKAAREKCYRQKKNLTEMAGVIADFKDQIEKLTEKQLDRQIHHLTIQIPTNIIVSSSCPTILKKTRIRPHL